jgi:hypothetical protein
LVTWITPQFRPLFPEYSADLQDVTVRKLGNNKKNLCGANEAVNTDKTAILEQTV